MASAQTSEKIKSIHKIEYFDFDPGNTNANDISWVDMRDYERFLIAFIRTIGTSALDTFEILANDSSDGSGTDVNIKVHAVASEPNLIPDYIFLECTAEEIGQLGAAQSTPLDLRYVTASVEFATNSEEAIIGYIRTRPRFASTGLTPDSIQ